MVFSTPQTGRKGSFICPFRLDCGDNTELSATALQNHLYKNHRDCVPPQALCDAAGIARCPWCKKWYSSVNDWLSKHQDKCKFLNGEKSNPTPVIPTLVPPSIPDPIWLPAPSVLPDQCSISNGIPEDPYHPLPGPEHAADTPVNFTPPVPPSPEHSAMSFFLTPPAVYTEEDYGESEDENDTKHSCQSVDIGPLHDHYTRQIPVFPPAPTRQSDRQKAKNAASQATKSLESAQNNVVATHSDTDPPPSPPSRYWWKE